MTERLSLNDLESVRQAFKNSESMHWVRINPWFL